MNREQRRRDFFAWRRANKRGQAREWVNDSQLEAQQKRTLIEELDKRAVAVNAFQSEKP